jgi:hypothetical protein
VSNNALIPADQAVDLVEQANAIRGLVTQIRQDVVEIGRRLTKCRDDVGHGNWCVWVETEFSWSERTALNYMRVFKLAQSKSANFADLSLPTSALYLLAAPSTPTEVQNEFIERAEAGEVIKLAEVRTRIAASAKTDAPISSKRMPPAAKTLEKFSTASGLLLTVTHNLDDLILPDDFSSASALIALSEIADAAAHFRRFQKRLAAALKAAS